MRRLGIGLIIVSLLIISLACGRPRPTPEPTTTEIIPGETKAPTDPFPFSDSEAMVITIDNQTPYAICYVYISSSEAGYWGEDQLSSNEMIVSGERRAFEVPAEPHDIMVHDCDDVTLGSAWEIEGPFTLTLGGSGTVPLRVINDSNADICYMMISPSTADTWGEDQLGLYEILATGYTRAFFVMPDTYDLMVLNCDDEEIQSAYEVYIQGEYEWIIDAEAMIDFEPSGDPYVITVENQTPNDLCYIFISSSDASTWGEDWLEGDEVLAPGTSRQFSIPGGAHDVSIQDCDNFVVDTAWELSENTVLTPGSEGDVALQIINESDQDICYLYISLSNASDWGEDWLGTLEIIPSETGLRVFYVAAGSYDITAQNCDGEDLSSEYEVSLQEGRSWTLSN